MVRVIAIIKDGSRVLGYRFLDENNANVLDFGTKDAIKYVNEHGCRNAHVEGIALVADEGTMDMLPVIDARSKTCIKNDKYIIVGTFKEGGRITSIRVTDYSGYIMDVETVRLPLLEDKGYVNAKIVPAGEKNAIRPLDLPWPVLSWKPSEKKS